MTETKALTTVKCEICGKTTIVDASKPLVKSLKDIGWIMVSVVKHKEFTNSDYDIREVEICLCKECAKKLFLY